MLIKLARSLLIMLMCERAIAAPLVEEGVSLGSNWNNQGFAPSGTNLPHLTDVAPWLLCRHRAGSVGKHARSQLESSILRPSIVLRDERLTQAPSLDHALSLTECC